MVVFLFYVLFMSFCYSGYSFCLKYMNPASSSKGFLLAVLMFIVVVINFSGFVMSVTGTMCFGSVLMLSFVLWLSSVMGLWVYLGFNGVLMHFLPQGLTGVFVFIMPVLELVSWLVRPITLGVRLGVNITSGHVLLCMLGYFSSLMAFSVFIGLILVFILEFLVSYLQGYIYVSLLVLYSS